MTLIGLRCSNYRSSVSRAGLWEFPVLFAPTSFIDGQVYRKSFLGVQKKLLKRDEKIRQIPLRIKFIVGVVSPQRLV